MAGALEDLRWIGPATAATLREADVDVDALEHRRVSHAELREAGVNPGVAAKVRREHSLPWSFAVEGGDLDRRAEQVRGLGEAEKAWVAASAGDWDADDAGSTDSSGDTDAPAGPPGTAESGADATDSATGGPWKRGEVAWRDRSRPVPVDDLECVSASDADLLAEAGITSVRSLSVADPEAVAASLDLAESVVREWRDVALARGE